MYLSLNNINNNKNSLSLTFNTFIFFLTDIIGVIIDEKIINEGTGNGKGRISLDLQLEG